MQAAAQTYAPPTLAFCKNLSIFDSIRRLTDSAFSSPFVLIADPGAYTGRLHRAAIAEP